MIRIAPDKETVIKQIQSLVPPGALEPRDAEVQNACRLLGRRLAEWVAVVADGRKDQHPLNKPESRTLPG